MKKSQKGPVPVTHDLLFRKALGHKDLATSFFKGFLPPEILAHCHLDELEKAPSAIVGKFHRDNLMDIVYACPFGPARKTVAICFLLEHKSEQANDAMRQLLRYMLEIWHSQQESKLPLTRIVPILVYHGPTDWQFRPFAAEFGPPDPLLDRYLPQFKYHCVDLHAMLEEEIERLADGVLALVFKALKHARQPNNLEQDLEQAMVLLGLPATSDNIRNLLDALIVYIIDRLKFSPEKIATIMKKQQEILKPQEGSILEYLLNQREEGIEKGREEGLLIAVKAMQSKAFTVEQIAGILEVEESWVRAALDEK